MGHAIRLEFSNSLIIARLCLVGNSKEFPGSLPYESQRESYIVGAGASLCAYFFCLGIADPFTIYIRTYLVVGSGRGYKGTKC